MSEKKEKKSESASYFQKKIIESSISYSNVFIETRTKDLIEIEKLLAVLKCPLFTFLFGKRFSSSFGQKEIIRMIEGEAGRLRDCIEKNKLRKLAWQLKSVE